ncbi:unnamed protein product [Eruca vesicaria subsp. sativa]|uniref:Protein root UVB sensitive/RUS domain-containing protein n=1 Tax=Eruca vesicaria subsp. sativa TaxID=29727 RepID=A0ABC8JCY8_ERUVS|nr:unnamed protein product [Eruca vesicaria subsp. sativa]
MLSGNKKSAANYVASANYLTTAHKNVAAVTSKSTRTPIYKAFAKGENIGDVTAKGECVGNIADLMGTGFSILISKRNPSLVTTFGLLSCGYLLSSYQEVGFPHYSKVISKKRYLLFHGKELFESKLPDERWSTNIDVPSTAVLCVQLNTLHYAVSQLSKLEDSIWERWIAKRPREKIVISMDYLSAPLKEILWLRKC